MRSIRGRRKSAGVSDNPSMSDADRRQFKAMCAQVATWPSADPRDRENDVMLKAAKQAFANDSDIPAALEILYLRHAMLRPLIDMIFNACHKDFGKARSLRLS
jgi:hypothetical protein